MAIVFTPKNPPKAVEAPKKPAQKMLERSEAPEQRRLPAPEAPQKAVVQHNDPALTSGRGQPKKDTMPIMVRLPRKLVMKLDEEAGKLGISRQEVIRRKLGA